jgi:hypothetical protein
LVSLKKSSVVVDTSLLAAIISLQACAGLPGRTDEAKNYAAFVNGAEVTRCAAF